MTGLDRLSGVWNRRWRWLLLLLLPAMAVAGYMAWWQDSEQGQSIVLIVPDSLDDEQAIYVNAWRDAGAEEGGAGFRDDGNRFQSAQCPRGMRARWV